MRSKRQNSRDDALARSKDLNGFLKEFGAESDRAAAILGAALLDELVSQLISAFLIDDPEEVRNLIERPLGAFGSRIRAAYCMGLITKEVFEDLNVIRSIRNLFAHRLHELSFERAAIVEECAKLQSLERIHMLGADSSTARGRFSLSVYFIQYYLNLERSRLAKSRRERPEFNS